DGLERAESAESAALVDRQQEKTKAAARTERQRGNFTAGFLSEPAKPDATRSRSRRGDCHSSAELTGGLSSLCFPAPNSNVGQNNLFFWIIQVVSSVSWNVFSRLQEFPVCPVHLRALG